MRSFTSEIKIGTCIRAHTAYIIYKKVYGNKTINQAVLFKPFFCLLFAHTHDTPSSSPSFNFMNFRYFSDMSFCVQCTRCWMSSLPRSKQVYIWKYCKAEFCIFRSNCQWVCSNFCMRSQKKINQINWVLYDKKRE